jgi:hypothetical protein
MPMSFRLFWTRAGMPARSAKSAIRTALCSATALASGAMLAASGPGCKASADDVPAGGGSFVGGNDAASNDCTTCAALECTGPWAVCLTDSRCVALRGCNDASGAAPSDEARQQCFCDDADAGDATPDGGLDSLSAYAAFAACSDARTCGACASDCTSACTGGAPNKKTTAASCGAGIADAGIVDAADASDAAVVTPMTASVDACASCVADKCGDAKKACALGSECSAFLACAYGCADASCVVACGDAHSTGRASAIELSSCTLTSCRSACGL